MSAPTSESSRERDGVAEETPADLEAAWPSQKRRMLIIVNPYATTVSDRLRHLVVYALQGRFEVDAVDTEDRGHATEICREAAHEGYDVVVAFGGDGTVNEAANGLLGSSTPLCCLPGGSANVFGKMLGIPGDLVDATEHLLAMADDWHPRKVDLGVVNGRCFTFASGLGLDASVVERVDANPRMKARFGAYFFTWIAVSTFLRRYLVRPPRLRVDAGGRTLEGVTAIVQNGSPFTYFQNRPIEIAEGASLHSGSLAGGVLHRATLVSMPFIAWRALSRRARFVRHRQVTGLADMSELTVSSADGRPLPLQVDGDYLGEVQEARYSILPDALYVVS
ncbi:MAG TPA: diacylglycerol kinase family protein [Solirubrobacteraceae bacterium]|jgi:diacylglycerol kinase family enzyme|nr:diacylglycerol kinase family protein [Solirubrobacteraceae bacterium]